MKFLRFIFLISVLLYFVINTSAQGANWEYYGEAQNGNMHYYDSESIVHTPNGMITVWTKTIYSDHGKINYISSWNKSGLRTKGYENLSYTMILLKLNCKTREFSHISGTDYNLSGDVLDSVASTIKEWKPIAPESMGDALFKKVCNIKNEKVEGAGQ